MTTGKLAILGGTPAIGQDIRFRSWPASTALDEELVLASLRQDKHAYGPHAQALEAEFAAWNGNTCCMATNSGTAALHMCVAAAGVQAGDEVITTALSWTSSASAIIHHSGVPVFVDVDWASMHMDPALIEAAITERTRAILVVHYWGVSCDMDPIMEIAKRHGLVVIEDACQAHSATCGGRRVGTIGDVSAFSLNQNKVLCGGEGGLFVTNNQAMFKRGKAVSAFSDMRPPHAGREYDDYGLGWMYRTSDLAAAYALSQLRQFDHTNRQALENWHHLFGLLEGTPHLVPPFTSADRPTNGYAYVWRVDPAYAREAGVPLRRLTEGIVAALKAEGVEMSLANWLLPAHSVFQAKNAFGHGAPWTYARPDISYDVSQFPVAQDCVDTCLWNVNTHRPPNGPAEVEALAGAIRKVFEQLDNVPVPQAG
ncbi:MAG: DegT/DnrJ/EryC1/StrS family aminotransferase [Chloroflexi bacterium]|jgi:perosamine synthetase|nr:DegT/DnrJ/EryC1/StrS family aminotransferase [Chloroflexota bacterium]